MNDVDRLVTAIKQQTELFLLDAGEFYPFASAISKEGDIIPIGAYFEDDNPTSQIVIELLEKNLNELILIGNHTVSAIAINVAIKNMDEEFDAVEIRFFELDKPVYQKSFKYTINEDSVDYYDV